MEKMVIFKKKLKIFSTIKTIYFNMHLTKNWEKFQFGFNLPFF